MTDNQPKKRGRKLGFTTGPRPIVYIAGAIIDGKICMDRFTSPSGADLSKDDIFAYSEQDVKAEFQDKFGREPSQIEGPFYDVKGTQIKSVKKTDSVNISLSDINLVGERKLAVFKGWQGYAYPIEGKSDVMFFMANKEVNPSLDAYRQAKPKAMSVLVSSLQFENDNVR